MKRELLTAVVQARRRKEAVVLVRGLTSGRQFIVTSKELAGDVDGIAPELRDAARAALDLEGARSFATDDERFLLQTLVAPAYAAQLDTVTHAVMVRVIADSISISKIDRWYIDID